MQLNSQLIKFTFAMTNEMICITVNGSILCNADLPTYDVFLSYHSSYQDTVLDIADRLGKAGFQTWVNTSSSCVYESSILVI